MGKGSWPWRALLALAISAPTLLALVGCEPAPETGVAPVRVPPPAPLAQVSGIHSVIVQISSLGPTHSPATVATWFTDFCARGTASPRDLVLQDIASSDGPLATNYLDAIAPFFPGGSRACFARLFVGTVDLQWTGTGTKYVAGIQDAAFTDRYLARSATVAAAFVARYPKTPIDWYLTYEANLNDLFYPSIEAAYRSLLTREIQQLSSIRPATFAWSPAFWFPYSEYSRNTAGMTQLKTMLSGFFSTLKSTTGGIRFVDLQDFVAGSGCQPATNRVTPNDAVAWANVLRDLRVLPEVAINVEQYSVDCATGVNVAGDSQELADRTSFYTANGLSLGPAFEIRYWAAASAASASP